MRKLLFVTILGIITFSSCQETETGGCIDLAAINYESWADYNDGSCLYECTDPYATNYLTTTTYPVCKYEGDVVFYLDDLAAQEFTNLSIPFLKVYIGNELLPDAIPTHTGFLSSVSCTDTDPEPVYFTYQWENEQITDLTYTVTDGTDYIWYSGIDPVICNNCLSLKLTWANIQEYQDSH